MVLASCCWSDAAPSAPHGRTARAPDGDTANARGRWAGRQRQPQPRRARCRHGQRRLHDMAGQRAHVFPLLSSTHRLERARARSESSSWIAPTDDDTAGGDEPLAGAAPCAAVPALSQRLGCRRTLPPRRAIPSRMGGWELAVRGSPGLFRPD